jgi:hypothetical protein
MTTSPGEFVLVGLAHADTQARIDFAHLGQRLPDQLVAVNHEHRRQPNFRNEVC